MQSQWLTVNMPGHERNFDVRIDVFIGQITLASSVKARQRRGQAAKSQKESERGT
jgi:hypothetical protein